MDFSGYLDVIVAGAGVMLLLSILNEAAVEALKSVVDRKVCAFVPYPTKLRVWHIGQRFWHAAIGRIIDDACAYLVKDHASRLPEAAKSTGRKDRDMADELRVLLAAAPASGSPSDLGLSAEGLANIKDEQLQSALTAWVRSRAAVVPATQAAFATAWETLEPLAKSYIASRYQLMRKAYQNRLRLVSSFVGLAMAAGLSVSGQFSLCGYLHNLTRDPAARRAAAAWVADEKNAEEFRKRLGAVAQSVEESANAVEREARALAALPAGPGGAQGRLTGAASSVEQVKASADALALRSAALIAAMPPRAMGALAEPLWRATAPRDAAWEFVLAWLDILAMTLLLSFGSENWHDILNAALSVRRQFGGGASK